MSYPLFFFQKVFKRQSLAKAVQTGLADEVHKVLRHLEDSTTSNSGKGGKFKGKKKVAVQHHLHSSPVAVEKVSEGLCCLNGACTIFSFITVSAIAEIVEFQGVGRA